MTTMTNAHSAGVRELKISGQIVQDSLADVSQQIGDLLNQAGGAAIIDLGSTEFIDSSGLSWLLVWHKRYCLAGQKLVLCNIPPLVMDVLRVMRLDLVLNIADDLEAARALCQGERP